MCGSRSVSDGRFERRAAIKFLRNFAMASLEAGAESFKREGRILGRLAHPQIAGLIDAGLTENEEPYLVLEYVEGEPIDKYCDDRALGVEARIRLFLDVLSAVAHAHSNLIVHRDIKPSNVLVRNDEQVKLLDFGIAKLLEVDETSSDATEITLESGAALTPRFAAPEQLAGGAISTATDVYSLGVLRLRPSYRTASGWSRSAYASGVSQGHRRGRAPAAGFGAHWHWTMPKRVWLRQGNVRTTLRQTSQAASRRSRHNSHQGSQETSIGAIRLRCGFWRRSSSLSSA